jgi:hypothetical protein
MRWLRQGTQFVDFRKGAPKPWAEAKAKCKPPTRLTPYFQWWVSSIQIAES